MGATSAESSKIPGNFGDDRRKRSKNQFNELISGAAVAVWQRDVFFGDSRFTKYLVKVESANARITQKECRYTVYVL